jgi:hypothetical protein
MAAHMSKPHQICVTSPRTVDIGPLRPEECSAVAQLHVSFFGVGAGHGHSLAMLGAKFLDEGFYRLNLDNPYFFVDVARYEDEIIAFSVYASDHGRVFRYTIRKHFWSLLRVVLESAVSQPFLTFSKLLGNLRFLTEALPVETQEIPGWFLLLGVKQPYRSREFQERAGVWIAGTFKERLERILREKGCREYWAAPAADNRAANQFYERIGATLFAKGRVQGMLCNYYRISTEGPIEAK